MSGREDETEQPGAAASPDARDRAVEALTHGYADGHLTEEELEAGLDKVYRATTLAELDAVTGGLPMLRRDAGSAGDSLATTDSRSTASARRPTLIRALFSGQERALTGAVPRSVSLRARMGYVEMDLTRATFGPGVTDIDVRALMGYVQIRLPADVRVECDGRALFGYFSLEGRGTPDAPGDRPVVRVSGRAILGFAECFTSSKKG